MDTGDYSASSNFLSMTQSITSFRLSGLITLDRSCSGISNLNSPTNAGQLSSCARRHQILNWISTGGNTASRPSLLKHFSGELIDECLDNGYLVEIRRNAFNEPVYAITNAGREKRDER